MEMMEHNKKDDCREPWKKKPNNKKTDSSLTNEYF